jgi:t-SNARE complex subunit (syntaxin)
MSYKSENWKEKLEQVRSHSAPAQKELPRLEEETAKPDPIEEEIASLLNEIDGQEEVVSDTTECPNCGGSGHIQEEVEEEKLSLEKTVEKLTERNMLGRLSKSLRLNEEGKDKLFNYFEKGELNQ